MMEYQQHHQVRDPLRVFAVCESGHVCESRQCVTGNAFVVLLAVRDEDGRGGEGRWLRRRGQSGGSKSPFAGGRMKWRQTTRHASKDEPLLLRGWPSTGGMFGCQLRDD